MIFSGGGFALNEVRAARLYPDRAAGKDNYPSGDSFSLLAMKIAQPARWAVTGGGADAEGGAPPLGDGIVARVVFIVISLGKLGENFVLV